MELYEFNKLGYASLPPMSAIRVEENTKKLSEWLSERHAGKYWMLLNNEAHYYTLYVWEKGSARDFAKDLVSLAQELGVVKSIEPTAANDGYEFWITDRFNETRMYMFFNYDRGVIKI